MTLEECNKYFFNRKKMVEKEMANINKELYACEQAGRFHAEYYEDLDRLETLTRHFKNLEESHKIVYEQLYKQHLREFEPE